MSRGCVQRHYLCLLGADNHDDGMLTPTTFGRVDLALALYAASTESGDSCTILATGGFGSHFNRTFVAHNIYVRRLLVIKGIPTSSIVTDQLESANTVEDAVMVKRYFGGRLPASILVITSDYHRRRAGLIFRAVLPGVQVTFAAAKSSITAYTRMKEHEEQSCDAILARGFIYHGEDRFPLAEGAYSKRVV